MQKLFFRLAILLITPLTLFGQTKTTKTSVYFDNDKYELRIDAQQTIDKMIEALTQTTILKITLSGNTDNSADSLYNLKLSDNRTEAVKKYFVTKGFKENIFTTNYFGEEKPIATNSNDEGKQKNRRVDIVFFYKQKEIIKQIPKDTIIPKRIVSVDTCKKDTVITLIQGTQLVFNRCEYLEIKNCIEFTETNNSQDILANGLTLMDESGLPITSCGMIRVNMKPGCTERECFKFPVKVRFPVPENKDCDYCNKTAKLWNINGGGRWLVNQGKKSEIKLIKVQGKMYYQFELVCPNNWSNCDCKSKGKKIKFKTKRNFQIVNIKVINDCPTAVVLLNRTKRRKNIAKVKVPCWLGNKTVIATIIDNKGDTLILKQQPLDNLIKRTMFSRCDKIAGQTIGYRFGVFPIAKRQFYRKYIIKSNQLTPRQ